MAAVVVDEADSPLSAMNPRDEQLLTDYYERVMAISEDVQREVEMRNVDDGECKGRFIFIVYANQG